jgi:hypothetical protein
MRDQPRSKLLHHRGFASDRQFLRPLAVHLEAITAAGKWQIDHFYLKSVTGLMIKQ